jgi:hypothetical protein
MTSFKITAQNYINNHRIAKVVEAKTAEIALRMVWQDLEAAGYYPLSAVQVQG